MRRRHDGSRGVSWVTDLEPTLPDLCAVARLAADGAGEALPSFERAAPLDGRPRAAIGAGHVTPRPAPTAGAEVMVAAGGSGGGSPAQQSSAPTQISAQTAVEGFAAFVDSAFADISYLRRITALSFSIPALRTQWLFSARAGQGTMAAAIAQRRPDLDDAQLEVMAATVVAVLGSALRIWSEGGDKDLRRVALDCFEGARLLFDLQDATGSSTG